MCNLETIQGSACVSGIGKIGSEIQLLQIIAQLLCNQSNPGCGTPSATINLSGAGVAGVNTEFTEDGPGLWIEGSLSFEIQLSGGVWSIVNNALEVLYTTPEASFPCSWSVGPDGVDPAPTGTYA